MKTKLIFSTASKEFEQWTDLSFVPRVKEQFNIQDILRTDEIEPIKQSARSWPGIRGTVKSVEYRHDDNEFYTEVMVWCDD